MIHSLRITALMVASALALGAVACDEKEEKLPEPVAEATEKAEEATEEVAAATEEAAEDIDLPTEQDFEEKAATEITAQNLEDELDELEDEIEESTN